MENHSPILKLIGDTPLLELTSFDTGKCRLFVKLENQNPGGSIKDRIGRSMIEQAELSGQLKPGATIVEATAGNTGLALALVAGAKGYKLHLVIPDKMAQEKLVHLRALGAKITITRSDVGKGHPQYYQDVAQRIADETPGAFYVNQFNNPANPLAHETTTGPEIWQQTDHNVDAIVCGVGSGGTLSGLANYFRKVAPRLEMVLADPVGSVLAEYIETGKLGQAGSWLVEGIGEDFIPGIADLSSVKKAYSISDRESLTTVRHLLSKEGILAGSSSGTLVAAAVRYCQEQKEEKTVVTFICDTGSKYLSKVYNDFWMAEQGMIDRPIHNDLRDLISRPYSDDAVIEVSPDDSLTIAYSRMRIYDVSQLPVIQNKKLVGIVDESDLLLAAHRDPNNFEQSVKSVMTTNVKTIDRKSSIDDLMKVFETGLVPVVTDSDGFYGLITRIDALNYLRKQRILQKRKT
ncbi:MAG TPA: cystathionine beta-synthase [Tepidisphaeraceae bacterium]|nr:cystathionine beta-synthase [Tepidisphaeraceae bacterium]